MPMKTMKKKNGKMKEKTDKKYLEQALAKFKELGLEAEYETSYGFGEGCYDIIFHNGGWTFEQMQLSWINASTAKEEWGGYEGEENPGAAWQMADEMGRGLLKEDGDVYHTEDFEEVIAALKRLIGAPVLFDTTTVEGLRDYLNHLVEEGKGAYKVEDYKGYELSQSANMRIFDKYQKLMINARFEDYREDDF